MPGRHISGWAIEPWGGHKTILRMSSTMIQPGLTGCLAHPLVLNVPDPYPVFIDQHRQV